MNPIRFATIGTNFIVDHFLEAASKSNEVVWRGAYSRKLEKAKEFIGDNKNVKAYDCLETLAEDPDIDMVYIASPNSLHAEQTIRMLEAGKHVLCEKPGSCNLKEWNSMVDAAKKAGKVLLEATRPLFSPGYHMVKKQLSNLGTIRKANFTFCQYSSRYDKFKNGIIENAFRPELGNGALMDIGIYCIESMVGLFGQPEQVQGMSYILKDSIDGMGTIFTTYEGMQCVISYSKISDSGFACEVQGEKGTLTYEIPGTPTNVKIKYLTGEEETIYDVIEDNNMIHEIKYFVEMVKKGELPVEYHKITTLSLEIVDEVKRQSGIIFPSDEIK